MDKETILRKYRQTKQDEGQERVHQLSDDGAFIGMLIVAVFIMVYQVYYDVPFGDVTALLFSFLAIGNFYRYKAMKTTAYFIWGIVYSAISIGFFILYVWQTL